MQLTKDFLIRRGACQEGIDSFEDQNFEGKDYMEVVRSFIQQGQSDYAGWLLLMKKTEDYVRLNGDIITMKAYQVFNPATGTHERYETEELATQALVEVIKHIVAHYAPSVCQEISNEKGDTAWTAVDLMPNIQITVANQQ